MAYVVGRPRGRFEIRESVHTPKGPRARSLANFDRLTDQVLETARQRAQRPFDADAVRASASKAVRSAAAGSAPVRSAAARRGDRGGPAGVAATARPELRRFVESSRRMAAALESTPAAARSAKDPGEALIDLLGVVAQVAPYRPARPAEPLRFPPLARLLAAQAARRAAVTH